MPGDEDYDGSSVESAVSLVEVPGGISVAEVIHVHGSRIGNMIANGPSGKPYDLTASQNHVSISVNRGGRLSEVKLIPGTGLPEIPGTGLPVYCNGGRYFTYLGNITVLLGDSKRMLARAIEKITEIGEQGLAAVCAGQGAVVNAHLVLPTTYRARAQ